MSDEYTHADPVDEAVRKRLAKLNQTPVDASRLEARLNATLAAEMTVMPRQRPAIAGRIMVIRRALALAAMIAVITGATAILLTVGQTPAIASPNDLVRVHRSFLDRSHPNIHVENADQANRVIVDLWPEAPKVPSPVADPVSACCVEMVNGTPVACVHLEHQGKAVTMVVANASQMHCPPGKPVTYDGHAFQVHQSEGLTMVMTMRADRCVCLVSELDAEALLELASQLRFD
ncbi:hypothetical protein HED60_05695 [Planctomycetales bacterium ZRK34]|nr:hypothetical protein HED60_05695 [Planctomycetales bacterium ZRK34]